jgi:hypothetical protein
MSHTRNERIDSNLDVSTELQYTNPGRTIAGSINPEVLVPSPKCLCEHVEKRASLE